jgi:dCTP deaminase
MRIGQFSFHKIDKSVERGYGHPELGSKYMNQAGPVASQYQRNAR